MLFEPEYHLFQLFPFLPTELRLKIWSLALDSLPAQHFTFKQDRTTGIFAFYDNYHLCRHQTPFHVPTLLHVCQEARDIALGKEGYALAISDDSLKGKGFSSTDQTTIRKRLGHDFRWITEWSPDAKLLTPSRISHEIFRYMKMRRNLDLKNGIYYSSHKDVIIFRDTNSYDAVTQQRLWNKKTGIRFGNVGTIAIGYYMVESWVFHGFRKEWTWDSVDRVLIWSMKWENQINVVKPWGDVGGWVDLGIVPYL
jgi:hypothetical protein